MQKSAIKPFDDNYAGQHDSTTYTASVDFNMDEVEAELNELPEQQRNQVAEVIRRMFLWCTAVDLAKKHATRRVGNRFIALSWVMDPGLFDGAPSATALARMLKIPACKFHALTGDASREFGITNRGQDHAWNRGEHAASKPTASQKPTSATEKPAANQNVSRGNVDVRQPVVVPAKNRLKESFSVGKPEAGSKKGQRVPAVGKKLNVP